MNVARIVIVEGDYSSIEARVMFQQFAGTLVEAVTTMQYAARRFADEFVLSLPKMLSAIPVFKTREEKLARMRRGWRAYVLPAVAAPIRFIQYRIRSSLGARNLGCWNFKKEKTK